MGTSSAGAPGGSPSPAWLPLTHTGLQMAPCGCFFDPRLFCIQWTSLPPPTTSMFTSLPSAVLWGPGGCGTPPTWASPGAPQSQLQQLTAYRNERKAVTPAPPVLLTSNPGYQHEGQSAQNIITGTATPAGAPPGSDILLGNNVPPSLCAGPATQGAGDPADNLEVSEEVLLEEALRLFNCSLDAVGVSQDSPSSSPMPGDPSGSGTAIPHCDFASLALPEELLTPDYSVPEATDIILSLEEFSIIRMEPEEPWGDEGMDPPPSQPAVSEKRWKKRGKSTLSVPARRRRGPAASTGVAGGD
ncbi:proline-rich protein 22 [Tyto alba]|uniref:proline-rich protein 22 n=1 Tax=Tyto alba TaxID=56313 RepID=UPI001C6861E0|nr:proline-rich protein 22 [Tyto alba]